MSGFNPARPVLGAAVDDGFGANPPNPVAPMNDGLGSGGDMQLVRDLGGVNQLFDRRHFLCINGVCLLGRTITAGSEARWLGRASGGEHLWFSEMQDWRCDQ
jgi:hypothetical protein